MSYPTPQNTPYPPPPNPGYTTPNAPGYGYGSPPSHPPGYSAPPPAYGAPQPGYGSPQPGYGPAQPGYGPGPGYSPGYVPPGTYGPVVHQPGAPPMGSGGGAQDGWMNIPQGIPNCPPGLEYLTMIDQLLVKQKVEMLEALTGYETKNKFTIK